MNLPILLIGLTIAGGIWGLTAIPVPVRAELRVEPAVDPAPDLDQRALTALEERLVNRNPALQELWHESPTVFRAVLDQLKDLLAEVATGPLVESFALEDFGILSRNPDLQIVYHDAPEAAVDLIRLIRQATRRPQKSSGGAQ